MYCRRGGNGIKDSAENPIHQTFKSCSNCQDRGLVDMSAALKLQESVGVCRGGLGVSEGAPPFGRLHLQLDQRHCFLFGCHGHRAVLRHQLATAAPGQVIISHSKCDTFRSLIGLI